MKDSITPEDHSFSITLWPPQKLTATLVRKGNKLQAHLAWKAPKIHSDAAVSYQIERKSWWPGNEEIARLICKQTKNGTFSFTDNSVRPNQMNEYRVRAIHRKLKGTYGPWSFPAAIYGFAYTTYQEMVRELKFLEKTNPDICRIIEAGPSGLPDYKIWCSVLGSDTQDYPDRPGILLVGNVHAGEIDGGEVCIGLIRKLVHGWQTGDRRIKRMLEKTQIRILPIFNPAGRSAFEKGFPGRGRKNLPSKLTVVPEDPLLICESWPSDKSAGMDPNRSFNVNWSWNQSKTKSDSIYAGSKPLAAPEARALLRIAKALKPQISIHYHGPCGYPLLPGNRPDGSVPVDRPLQGAVGREFARLSNPEFSNNVAEKSSEPIRGMGGIAHDWCYQEFYGIHFLAEGFYGQVPKDARIPAVAGSKALPELIDRNFDALLWMAKRVCGTGVTITVQDEKHRPLVAEIEIHKDPHCSVQKTDPKHGRYRRILSPGNYRLGVRKIGYKSEVIPEISVSEGKQTDILVVMKKTSKFAP